MSTTPYDSILHNLQKSGLDVNEQMPRMPKDILENYLRYSADPWAFLSECVYTLDQVDKESPIKQYPYHYEYLKLYVRVWQKYYRTLVPKSRRMVMSWTHIGLYLWDTIFSFGRNQAFVSKKEDDSADLVDRAKFIYEHIPEDKIPHELLPLMKPTIKPPKLVFPQLNSTITGYQMTADALRQFTFSGILGDEMAFWPKAEDFYSAAYPTLEGGGRMNLISSAAPGFFKRLVHDTQDIEDDVIPERNSKFPIEGVELWINEKNKFLVFQPHYTANPYKRGKDWKATAAAGMSKRKWNQEYEINWDTFEGMSVYSDYQKHIHVTREVLAPQYGLPLITGWDFGLTPACILGQYVDGQLRIIKEFVAKGKPISVFAPDVLRQLNNLYPGFSDQQKHYFNYVDPAGFDKSQVDATTCVQKMHEAGFRNIGPGGPDNLFEPRREAVESLLTLITRSGPGILISEPNCPILVKGFAGGYQFPESNFEIEPTKLRPEKNEYSHPHDALQYLCRGLIGLKHNYNIKDLHIPEPSYNFQTANQSKNRTYGGIR